MGPQKAGVYREKYEGKSIIFSGYKYWFHGAIVTDFGTRYCYHTMLPKCPYCGTKGEHYCPNDIGID